LLRVIDGKAFSPVGGEEVRKPDIRIIAATNRDSESLVRQGRMREDFFFRMHVIPVYVPPLRDRKEDLALLVDHFLDLYAGSGNGPKLTGAMLDAAYAHHWPGNVRELQNVIHRYVSVNRFELSGAPAAEKPAEEMLQEFRDHPASLKDALLHVEKKLIVSALKKHRWRRSETAAVLGINRRTLFKKIQQHGIK
ncbi:MAG: sigma 54-interacting transcriptional regulator, partial [Desulfosalsimonas sp.]